MRAFVAIDQGNFERTLIIDVDTCIVERVDDVPDPVGHELYIGCRLERDPAA